MKRIAGGAIASLANSMRLLVFLGLLATAATFSDAQAQITNCDPVASFTYPNATITARNFSAGGAYVSSDTWHIAYSNLPPYCEIQATLTPVADSSIKVRVWLPIGRYNGRYLGTGNGGYAGAFFDSELAQGINNGFATAQTDLGLGSCGSVNVNADGCVGHPEKWKDFGYRATHLTTEFAKALIQVFYGQPANKSYFAGCSTGGQQALMAAQRYPNDYDGILAGAPAHDRTHLHTTLVASYRATHLPPTGFIPPSKFDVVNAAVVKQCRRAGKDSANDKFISDPATCGFNPASLQCPGNIDGLGCLTTDQVNAMNVYYQGSVNPVTGALIHPGPARGSETSNATALGLAVNEAGAEPLFDSLFKWVFGLTWQWQNFDFNQDMTTVDQVLAADLNATNPDLSAFRNRGGKLILYHGWADPLLPSIGTVNYYNKMAQTMFGETSGTYTQTQTFSRLYMAPGVWHCGGSIGPGPGPSSFGGVIQQPAPSFDPQHDLLSALTQWVENGAAPGPVIATKYNSDRPDLGIQMQRPLCVYPRIASYRGGDNNLPSSFSCDVDFLVAHDFDGNGKSDILWRNTSGETGIWSMNGATVLSASSFGFIPNNWSLVGQRDFNGDGKTDFLWLNSAGDVNIWLMNGAQFTSIGIGNIGTGWSVVGTGDFNGDGKGDILWRSPAGDIGIWFMNGTTIASRTGFGNVGPNWAVIGTADFDRDGKSDILWRSTSDDIGIWFMNGGSIASMAPLGNVGPVWSVVGTGDFNGDGRGDILWQSSFNDVGIWFMNGGTIASFGPLGNVGPNWAVKSVGDYNGEGKSDILLRSAAHDISIWFMNDGTIASMASYGNVGPNWTVQNASSN